MERSIVIPATTRVPQTEEEAKRRKASIGLISDLVNTLKVRGIYAKIDNDDGIIYLDSHRHDIENIAKRFELQLFVCNSPHSA